MNIMCNILHCRWRVVLQIEWSVLPEYYVEFSAQQMDCGIVGGMQCDTVNIMWEVLHSKWTVLL